MMPGEREAAALAELQEASAFMGVTLPSDLWVDFEPVWGGRLRARWGDRQGVIAARRPGDPSWAQELVEAIAREVGRTAGKPRPRIPPPDRDARLGGLTRTGP